MPPIDPASLQSAVEGLAPGFTVREFRDAMGQFATGVVVISTEIDGDAHAMTANAFMSGSLEAACEFVDELLGAAVRARRNRYPRWRNDPDSHRPSQVHFDVRHRLPSGVRPQNDRSPSGLRCAYARRVLVDSRGTRSLRRVPSDACLGRGTVTCRSGHA